jgi:long-chain acyl-CoA synthetase
MKENSYSKYQPEWGTRKITDVPGCGIFDFAIRQPAEKYRRKTAIINYGRHYSYSDLEDLTNRFANALIKLGIRKGDRVATLMPNCLQYFIAFYGIAKAGGITVPCNVMYKKDELAYLIKDSNAKAIVVLDSFYPVVEATSKDIKYEHIIVTSFNDFADESAVSNETVRRMLMRDKREIPAGTIDFVKILKDSSATDPAVRISGFNDLAVIQYTSGTTGFPKGAMLTHSNFCATGVTLTNVMDMTETDVHILIFPMFHIAAYCFHIQALVSGGTVIPLAMFDPKEMLSVIEKNKVTVLFAPPTLFIGLMSHPDFKKNNLNSLRIAVGCGAATPIEMQNKWEEIVGTPLLNGYGCTETSGIAPGIIQMPNKPNVKPGGMGWTVGEAKVVDSTGNTVTRGTVGELVHRGPGIAKGYWNKPEETKKQFSEDGWWRSGDACYMDEDESLFFQYRIKDLIVSSGYNVSPVEIENTIYKHEAVKEVCVYGIPDEYRGESAKALITLKDEYKGKITESEMIAWCKEQMATFKVPKVIEFGDIPKTASGKVLRYILQDKDKQKYLKK